MSVKAALCFETALRQRPATGPAAAACCRENSLRATLLELQHEFAMPFVGDLRVCGPFFPAERSDGQLRLRGCCIMAGIRNNLTHDGDLRDAGRFPAGVHEDRQRSVLLRLPPHFSPARSSPPATSPPHLAARIRSLDLLAKGLQHRPSQTQRSGNGEGKAQHEVCSRLRDCRLE